jgi:hypothetical protein
MDTIGAEFGREIQNTLKSLSEEAQRERLEYASSLFDELRVILAEEDIKGSPTGYLTVLGWTKLLNEWENITKGKPARKIKYTLEFVVEVMGRDGMYAPPMAILLTQMRAFLETAAVSVNSEIQVAA